MAAQDVPTESAEQQTRPLGDLWDRSRNYSGKASDRVRTSALAGLAVAWLFTGSSEGDLSELADAPRGLLIASALFAASLAADILHYFMGAWSFGRYSKSQEDMKKVNTDDVPVPPWVPGVPRFFYRAKVPLLFAGFGVLVYVFLQAAF